MEPDELAVGLRRLVELAGPSGAEENLASAIEQLLGAAGVAVERDGIGNLRTVNRSPPRPRFLVTAHMDQVGYMVSHVGEDEARCVAVGDPVIPRSVWFRALVLGDHPPLAADVRVMGEDAAAVRSVFLTDVAVGDRVVFDGRLERGPGGQVRGPSLDNRIGCLVAIHAAMAMAAETDTVAFAWTVQEETTQAGVIRVAQDLQPEAVIAVDVTPAAVNPEVGSLVTVGRGPALTLLDGGMVGDAGLLRAFRRAASRSGVSWQPEVVRDGLSEAGHAQATLGISALALLVPIEDSHQPVETGDLNDALAAVDLLLAGLRQLLSEA